jgi:hypothetical protein
MPQRLVTFLQLLARPHVDLALLRQTCRTFHRLYAAEGAALLVLRFTSYRWQRQHYYLFDWQVQQPGRCRLQPTATNWVC